MDKIWNFIKKHIKIIIIITILFSIFVMLDSIYNVKVVLNKQIEINDLEYQINYYLYAQNDQVKQVEEN